MNKLHGSLAGLILLTLLVTACSSLPIGGNSLEGTAWVLTHIGSAPVIVGSQPTLRFDSGQVSGFGSCNGFGGEYDQSGSQLTITGIMSTLMACYPIEITQQESAYFSALASTASFKPGSGVLKTYAADGALLLTFSSQDTRLEGKTWQMTSYFDGENAFVSALEGSIVTAQFEDGIVSGSAGCNHYSGPYETKEEKLSIASAAITEMYCEAPAGLMNQETRYMAALAQADTYRVEGTHLTLYNEAGGIMVEFSLLP